MGRPTYSARRDKNDDIVKKAIEANGWQNIVKVIDISRLGGVVDRLIYIDKFCFAVEIKQSRKSPLTIGEMTYPGYVYIVTNEAEFTQIVVALLPVLKKMSKIPFPKILKNYERKIEREPNGKEE